MRNPTLFDMEKLEDAAKPASELKVERPNSLPGIFLETSAFTADGWQGSFYPPGMKSRDFLSYYATQFATVEVDSTFYRCPSASTVSRSEEHTSELQSHSDLVCRLLLEKKKKQIRPHQTDNTEHHADLQSP